MKYLSRKVYDAKNYKMSFFFVFSLFTLAVEKGGNNANI